MPIYRNTRKTPLPVQYADGDAKSIGARKNFHVDRQTETSPLFAQYRKKGIVKFISEDKPEKVEEVKAPEPKPAPPTPDTETTPPEESSSDSPGRTLESDADASAEVVDPTDTQDPTGEPDSPESGASESKSRKGSTDDGGSGGKKKSRKKRRRKSSKSNPE